MKITEGLFKSAAKSFHAHRHDQFSARLSIAAALEPAPATRLHRRRADGQHDASRSVDALDTFSLVDAGEISGARAGDSTV